MTSPENRAEIHQFRGYCRNCGARTVRRGYCSRRCALMGALLRRAVRNAGCKSLQELVDRTPPGERVVLDFRKRNRKRRNGEHDRYNDLVFHNLVDRTPEPEGAPVVLDFRKRGGRDHDR